MQFLQPVSPQTDTGQTFAAVAKLWLESKSCTSDPAKLLRLLESVDSLRGWFGAAPLASLSVEWVEEFALARYNQRGSTVMLREIAALKAILGFAQCVVTQAPELPSPTPKHPVASEPVQFPVRELEPEPSAPPFRAHDYRL